MLTLDRALRLEPDAARGWPCLAFVGAGGKTTAMFQLARSLASRAGGAWVTTTTHLGMEQARYADQSFQLNSIEELSRIVAYLTQGGVILFTGPCDMDSQRLMGLPESWLDQLWKTAQNFQIPLLVEADGSRQKPLKAPDSHEPVIPACADQVVVCAGLSGLGNPLEERFVHRTEIFSRLAGASPGEKVTAQYLARVLIHPSGGLKNIQPGLRKVLLLNQADTPDLETQAGWIASKVQSNYDVVMAGRLAKGGILRIWEPLAGIILAAGGATRFGKPKQLLEVGGQPMVRRSAQLALAAGLHPVLVVCGAYEAEVKQTLAGLPVECVDNPAWELGQSTSLRAGIQQLSSAVGGAIFLLSDQPFISLDILLALKQVHANTLAPIVAPRVGDQRVNPVLFDRVTFRDLLTLEGDVGGRAVIRSGRYPVHWLDWLDAALLQDIDTPQDYERLV